MAFGLPNEFWNYIWLLGLHVLWTSMDLLPTYESWTFTYLSLQWFHHYIIISTSCDEDVTCHYLWWLGLIMTNDMDFLQWWHGCHSCLCSSCNFWSLMYSPSKGYLILEPLRCFDHQSFNVFFVLWCFLYLPFFLDLLHACLPCCSWNTCNCNHSWQATISLKISYSNMFYAFFSCLYSALGRRKSAYGHKGTLQKDKGLKREGLRAFACTHALKRKRQ